MTDTSDVAAQMQQRYLAARRAFPALPREIQERRLHDLDEKIQEIVTSPDPDHVLLEIFQAIHADLQGLMNTDGTGA
jgi:hypothetical protein